MSQLLIKSSFSRIWSRNLLLRDMTVAGVTSSSQCMRGAGCARVVRRTAALADLAEERHWTENNHNYKLQLSQSQHLLQTHQSCEHQSLPHPQQDHSDLQHCHKFLILIQRISPQPHLHGFSTSDCKTQTDSLRHLREKRGDSWSDSLDSRTSEVHDKN